MSLFLKIALPLFFLILFAPFSQEIDLFISSNFYINGSFSKNPIWDLFYNYGPYPAFITAFICVVLLLKQPRTMLLYILTFGIGGGLITQALLKTFWIRPRPCQIDIFGGINHYQPFWISATKLGHKFKSMPCAHCTSGFVFFALIFMGMRLKNRPLTFLGFFLVIFLGGGLSLARIAKGGHFISDVLVGMIIMWVSAVSVDAFLKLKSKNPILNPLTK